MSRVNLGLHQSDVSVAWDFGPHDFSILRYWLDESPTYVSALSRGCIIPSTPDVAFINLEFLSRRSLTSSFHGSRQASCGGRPSSAREKMVVYDDTSNEPVRSLRRGCDVARPREFRRIQPHVPHR